MGLQIEIFKFSNLGPSRTFWKLGWLKRKQPSSPGRAGQQPPPYFSINRPSGGCSKGSLTPMLCISAVLGEKTCFREENPSRGTSVTLPRRFREQFREDLSSFFVRSSCVLRSSTSKCSNLRLSIHFLFFWLSSSFCSFRFSFLPFYLVTLGDKFE